MAPVFLWNNVGDIAEFRTVEGALKRCRYHGESGTPGVSMFRLDGQVYFTKDLPTPHQQEIA